MYDPAPGKANGAHASYLLSQHVASKTTLLLPDDQFKNQRTDIIRLRKLLKIEISRIAGVHS